MVPSKPQEANREKAFQPVGEVTLCLRPEDYDGLGARITIASFLVSWLETQGLAVSEVLYGQRPLKQVLDQKMLVEAALVRLVRLQAAAGQDAGGRRAALTQAMESMLQRAVAAEAALSAVPKQMSAVNACLAGSCFSPKVGAEALLRAALARDLGGMSGWAAKAEHILGLIWQQPDEKLRLACDDFLADWLWMPASLRELVPVRGGQGAWLGQLVELVHGRLGAEGLRAGVGNLALLFRQGRLPMARLAVLDRLRRQLRSQDLLHPDPAREAELVRSLTGSLVTAEGVTGGPGMAAALTERAARRFEAASEAGFSRAIAAIEGELPELLPKLQYLIGLAGSELGPRQAAAIQPLIGAALESEPLLDSLALGPSQPAASAARALEQMQADLALSALAPAEQAKVSARLGGLLDPLAVSGRLAGRIEEVMGNGGRQALKWVDLVSAGLLGDPKALVAVRRRLIELMRKPGFEAELVAARSGLGNAQQDLRRLKQVLDRLSALDAHRELAVAGPAPAPAAADEVTVLAPIPVPAPAKPGAAPVEFENTMTAPVKPPAPAPARIPAAPVPVSRTEWVAAEPHAAPKAAGGFSDHCNNCFARKGQVARCPECGWIEGTPKPGPHLQPGSRLVGRYRVGKLLGQGGFGATYLGWDDRLDVRVAVKEYFPASLVARVPGGANLIPYSITHGEAFTTGITKFLAEARTLARLRDIREIVGVQDYFEENATAYLVMEFLQGRTLKMVLAENGGPLDYRRALLWLTPIMRALQEVHEHGLVHRDISPDNIYISDAGQPKLLDFGAARETVGGAGMTVILKPGYAPPEQYFSDSRQGPWSDVYAMTASFYCCITGKPPADATKRMQEECVIRPSAMGVSLPAELEAVVMAGLALRRQERYQSMKALLAAISRAIG